MRKLALAGVLIVGGLLALPLAPRAEASGIITHSWMAAEAIPLVDDPGLRALLRAHAADVEGGAHFPDSGYAAGVVGVENDYGEEAHWPRWHESLARQIANDPECPNLSAADGPCARRIALLFGSVAHGMGDQVWDWLFEPNGPDQGESYVPPALADQFSTGGLEMQMDLVAIGDHDRRTTPEIPDWPNPTRLAGSFARIGRNDVSVGDMDLGHTAISVARNAERTLTQRYRADIVRNMPWTSSHLVTAPGGIRFAARAIAAAWDNLWARMHDEQPATTVSTTHPADGQTRIPRTGWDRETFQPGSAPDRGGARNRITAVLDDSLPFLPQSGPGDIDEELPDGAMTLTKVDGEVPVALREGYPRQVPYGGESGEHVIDLQPDANLEPCTDYRVDVTDALLDQHEQPVTPYAWTFTTDGCPGDRHQPDVAARRGNTGAWVGDDVYTPGGAGQSRLLRTPPGSTATFWVRIQNDGNQREPLRIRGQGTVPGRFAVHYFSANRNVTGQVVAGTFRTRLLSAQTVDWLRVEVQVLRAAPRGASTTRLVTVRSTADPDVVDAVKLTVNRSTPARRTPVETVPVELTDAELAEAARYAQVCVLG